MLGISLLSGAADAPTRVSVDRIRGGLRLLTNRRVVVEEGPLHQGFHLVLVESPEASCQVAQASQASNSYLRMAIRALAKTELLCELEVWVMLGDCEYGSRDLARNAAAQSGLELALSDWTGQVVGHG